MVYYNIKTYDIREENVTTRREISIEIIRSRAFRDIREGVGLRRLMLQSLECNVMLAMSTSHLRF
jgi:hypothetical protein